MKNKEIKILKKVNCNIGVISLRDDKIPTFHPHKHAKSCNINDIKEMYTIFMEITKGVPHLYFSDNSTVKSFGSEERVFVRSNFHHFALACAIKETSAITRYITHTMIYLNKPQIPLKMFKTEDDGINWLKSLNLN
tara:strand:- start:6217 stop:6624 length:408 start_codon:yes stop_codon:yes gene_type:complete